ncbi:MAG: hypothetical protein KGH65_05305 [Candidatus Micrarchaeota archaeon]|nr:hypothetical protein [Candidatus Micrarchaeota archaeon]
MLTAIKFSEESKDDVTSAIRKDAPIASPRSSEQLMVSMPFGKHEREVVASAIEKLRLKKSWSGSVYQARDKLDRVERQEEAIGFISSMLRSGGGVASRIQIEGAIEFLSFCEAKVSRTIKNSTETEIFAAMVKTGVWFLKIRSALMAALCEKMDESKKRELSEILDLTKGPLERSMQHSSYGFEHDAPWKASFAKSLEKIDAKLKGEMVEPFQDKEAETIFDVFYLVKMEIESSKMDGHVPNPVKEADIDRILSIVYQAPSLRR